MLRLSGLHHHILWAAFLLAAAPVTCREQGKHHAPWCAVLEKAQYYQRSASRRRLSIETRVTFVQSRARRGSALRRNFALQWPCDVKATHSYFRMRPRAEMVLTHLQMRFGVRSVCTRGSCHTPLGRQPSAGGPTWSKLFALSCHTGDPHVDGTNIASIQKKLILKWTPSTDAGPA